MIHVTTFKTRDELAEALTQALVKDLQSSAHPFLALSGGTTPLPLLQRLKNADLPWTTIWVTLVDERWVKADDPASNEGLIRTHLLNYVPGHFFPLKTDHAEPEKAISTLESRFVTLPPLTSIVLGMGSDGHFASLFPDDPNLDQGLDLQSPHTFMAARPQSAPHLRMTMTLKTILQAPNRYIYITGADKRAVLQNAIEHKDPKRAPIAALLQHPCEIYYAP